MFPLRISVFCKVSARLPLMSLACIVSNSMNVSVLQIKRYIDLETIFESRVVGKRAQTFYDTQILVQNVADKSCLRVLIQTRVEAPCGCSEKALSRLRRCSILSITNISRIVCYIAHNMLIIEFLEFADFSRTWPKMLEHETLMKFLRYNCYTHM